jgi:two-component system, NarL family, nitrate/nitrite response regulator NarL
MQHETVIVQQNGLRREGLARCLDNSPFRIVASLPHCDDPALSCLVHGLLLVDIGEDVKSGVRAIECFKERQPTARIVALAERSNVEDAISTFRAGANAYLAEVTSRDALIKSLELVMLGKTIIPFQILSEFFGQNPCVPNGAGETIEAGSAAEFDYSTAPSLSAREKHILGCLANGSSNKVIAREVDAAEATVKVHVKSILRKLRVQNRTQAAIWALNHRTSLPVHSAVLEMVA